MDRRRVSKDHDKGEVLMAGQRAFTMPSEVRTIPGTEGWERMYPYFYRFSKDDAARKAYEESVLWYYDGLHYPEPMYPFDLIWDEAWFLALSQYNSRIFMIPPALGIDHRIVNGYIYISPVPVADPAEIEKRVPLFMERAGYYYEHWDELYAKWQTKMEDLIKELEGIGIKDLPGMEDSSLVFEGVGLSSGYQLAKTYNHLIDCALRAWQYHFEFLNLGYAAYLPLTEFCHKAFPGIEDRTVTKMVAGIDVILFQPDERLKELASAAVDLGVADIVKSSPQPGEVIDRLGASAAGREWLERLEKAKYPWFYLSSGTGWYHDHYSWLDRMEIPFMSIRSYIEKLEQGHSLARPLEEVRAERDRIIAEYTELLPSVDDENTFKQLIAVAQKVFPYVENHNFYVEHWFHGVFWNKIRELSRIFVNHGFFADVEDIWYLNRYEIQEALYDLLTGWATGVKARGPSYWPPEIAWRKGVIQKFREFMPPPALGLAPETVSEPFTIMLWGITNKTMDSWLSADGTTDLRELNGFAGSAGLVEGKARVVRSLGDLKTLQEGEILVAATTSPSWAPIFTRIRACVTDVGGIMSHAAIVCREYGLPAVVGTGFATATIKTGQMIRVDGNQGVITIL